MNEYTHMENWILYLTLEFMYPSKMIQLKKLEEKYTFICAQVHFYLSTNQGFIIN
jgi:hypothetical protein